MAFRIHPVDYYNVIFVALRCDHGFVNQPSCQLPTEIEQGNRTWFLLVDAGIKKDTRW